MRLIDLLIQNNCVPETIGPLNGLPGIEAQGDIILTYAPGTPQETIDLGNFMLIQWLKSEKIDKINSRTDELLSQGFEFNGKQYSLSSDAMQAWTNMFLGMTSGLLTPPLQPGAIDDSSGTLATKESITSFCQTAMATGKQIMASGATLRDSVLAATTQQDINNVIDQR